MRRREGGRPGSGRGPAPPGPWLPDKGVLEKGDEAHFIFPQLGLVGGAKWLNTHLCPLLAEDCVCWATNGLGAAAPEARSMG